MRRTRFCSPTFYLIMLDTNTVTITTFEALMFVTSTMGHEWFIDGVI